MAAWAELYEGLWKPIGSEYQGQTYAEYAGDRPDPQEYMPQWPVAQCTHWQMYEEVTEGTPVSPVFSSADLLKLIDGSYRAVFWRAICPFGLSTECLPPK